MKSNRLTIISFKVLYKLMKYIYVAVFFYVTPWVTITVPYVLEKSQNIAISEVATK